MSTVSPTVTKRIRRCFFFSLASVIVVPILCILFGVTLHPKEFQYTPKDVDLYQDNRTVYLHADLISADLKQGTMVLDWSILTDSCTSECTNINIYFDRNLLSSDTDNSGPSGNNRPLDPTFIWNATAGANDTRSSIPTFKTELAVFPPATDKLDNQVRYTHSSLVYYPFDSYEAVIFGFAEDASTNATVSLFLYSTSGLAVGLKISAELSQDDDPDVISVVATLRRGTLVRWYCVFITITFWLITLAICLVMIMTVGFGFQQRNEIVVVPVSTVFAFTQLRSSMPGAPDGFGDVLDFVGVLPCLVLLSICAVTMVGIYVFTDPAKDSREKLTWSAFVQTLIHIKDGTFEKESMYKAPSDSQDMLEIPLTEV